MESIFRWLFGWPPAVLTRSAVKSERREVRLATNSKPDEKG